ncbi:hypothetical protein [Hymenobacter sublimis]|uniref:Toll/interleukin-1 receptor domain-containing protein n=1 Tax=Hymenobacter sublimis TaxID=2933777 RepID=A0ABY4JE43_9BACT|nr:hypothetical protein [Hymenobacter sublimis]UPL50209.1 hypothetical protein MWH26_04695 [Hymenobacter sublimis]
MYRGFKLTLDDFPEQESAELHRIGSDLFAEQKKNIRRSLDTLVLEDGSIDASELQDQWFPELPADVFISHSHRDEQRVLILAGYLKKYLSITSFIDSAVWGYGGDLLKDIDNEYCSFQREGKRYYNYDARNLSTSHVHLMVASALNKMIDSTECIFFLETPNSVKTSAVMDTTLSPWIHSEILTTQFIRKRKPWEHANRRHLVKSMLEGGKLGTINESVSMTYPIKTGHLTPINLNASLLLMWRMKALYEDYKLDALYQLYPAPTKQQVLNG